MCSSSASGGLAPCLDQTTIGTSQISQSAIQQVSSSWYRKVMAAASQRSHPVTLPESTIQACPQLLDESARPLGATPLQYTTNKGGPDNHPVGVFAHLAGLGGVGNPHANQHGLFSCRLQPLGHLARRIPEIRPLARDAH